MILNGEHRDLHSFPTRRSSDRDRVCEAFIEVEKGDIATMTIVRYELSQAVLRPEEHTSELQSPDQIVCRLLLEKKNKTEGAIVNRNECA